MAIKFLKLKTPQSLWGFVLSLALASMIIGFAGCSGTQANIKTVDNPRYSFSYNADVFDMKTSVKDDYSFAIKELGSDFEATITVFVPTTIKEAFESYYETAKLDFQTSFEKILNEKETKSQLKGISTSILVVTAQKASSTQTWTGMLKLSVVKDGLLMMKITCNASRIEKFRKDINLLFESVVLRGKDD